METPHAVARRDTCKPFDNTMKQTPMLSGAGVELHGRKMTFSEDCLLCVEEDGSGGET